VINADQDLDLGKIYKVLSGQAWCRNIAGVSFSFFIYRC